MDGYNIVPSFDDADVVVVNTCGFIDSARQESLDAIGDVLEEAEHLVRPGDWVEAVDESAGEYDLWAGPGAHDRNGQH